MLVFSKTIPSHFWMTVASSRMFLCICYDFGLVHTRLPVKKTCSCTTVGFSFKIKTKQNRFPYSLCDCQCNVPWQSSINSSIPLIHLAELGQLVRCFVSLEDTFEMCTYNIMSDFDIVWITWKHMMQNHKIAQAILYTLQSCSCQIDHLNWFTAATFLNFIINLVSRSRSHWLVLNNEEHMLKYYNNN